MLDNETGARIPGVSFAAHGRVRHKHNMHMCMCMNGKGAFALTHTNGTRPSL